jgi:membrane fusion protein (multidrug efflux system)
MNKPIDLHELAEIGLTTPVPDPSRKRRTLFVLLAAGVATAALGAGAYQVLVGSHYVSTDNAYVGADTAQVTPLVGGTIAQVLVSDTQRVAKGQVLARLDDTDARLAVDQAEAALGQAERRVRGYFANDRGLSAQVAGRAADQSRAAAQRLSAQADLDKASLDLDRRKALAATGAISGEELTTAQNAYSRAAAALASARAAEAQAAAGRDASLGALDANRALTADTSVDTNPEVAAARARLAQARLDLSRTVIRAPLDGVVTRRQAQVGQKVAAGAQLMMVVPVEQSYVDANFKEGQLAKVRPGQTVELESDLYGSKVKFHGQVTGLSGGSGSAFALIPAQNATGNWIKVVQRVPVRIALRSDELTAHPLRVGLSMTATIRTGG